MELTLIYDGILKPQNSGYNKGIKENKHDIRCKIHQQLKELWKRAPFKPDPKDFYKNIGGFNFLPLAVEGRNEIAEMNITLLRPTPIGHIVGQGGDIDNRIKTLLDALRMPKNNDELPKGYVPNPDENPFYCLLEDDKLITKLSISTARLLIPTSDKHFVHLIITVHIKQIEPEWGHMIISIR
jgi:hypothetical protein